MAFCERCGAQIPEGARFCQICGNPVAGSEQQPGGPVYGQPYTPPVVGVTVGMIYSKAFAFLGQKPILLWGLSVLCSLLTLLACIFGVLPIISIPIVLVLEVGMASVYLDGYRGQAISSDQLFKGFKQFFRFAGGMAWMCLWVFIWSLIPLAGVVMGIIKGYSYRFVPYIMLNDPEISATDALRASMKMTDGYKGKMFGADVLIYAIILVLSALFSFLARYGVFFVILYAVIVLLVSLVSPLILGIFKAAFYDEIDKLGK